MVVGQEGQLGFGRLVHWRTLRWGQRNHYWQVCASAYRLRATTTKRRYCRFRHFYFQVRCYHQFLGRSHQAGFRLAGREIRHFLRLQILKYKLWQSPQAFHGFFQRVILRGRAIRYNLFIKLCHSFPSQDLYKKDFHCYPYCGICHPNNAPFPYPQFLMKLIPLKTSTILKCLFKNCEYTCSFGKSSYFCNRFKRAAQKPGETRTRRFGDQRW
ncbi:hypothetical protein D3C86_1358170 [compost metagenome]